MIRKILWLLATLLLTNAHLAEAQQPKRTQKIGLLLGGRLLPSSSDIEAFRQSLRELGYVEGQNVAIESRVQERGNRLADLAAELVRLKVDVIVATSTGPPLPPKKQLRPSPL